MDELTLLKAENARLKMLLAHVLKLGDSLHNDQFGVELSAYPLIVEARRFASPDGTGLQELLTP